MEIPPRLVAKHVASSIVGLFVARAVGNAADRRNLKKDSIPVLLVGTALAFVVAAKLEPVTDKIVDTTFDFVAAKRQAWKNRKSK